MKKQTPGFPGVGTTAKEFLAKHRRNNALFDVWSLVHIVTGVAAGWLMDPFIGLLLLVVWEPVEVLVLSPFLARFGILFGHESLKNSLSDVFFDALGVAAGYWGMRALSEPPFVLF